VKWVVVNQCVLRGEGLLCLIRAAVCLLVLVPLSVSAGNGWPQCAVVSWSHVNQLPLRRLQSAAVVQFWFMRTDFELLMTFHWHKPTVICWKRDLDLWPSKCVKCDIKMLHCMICLVVSYFRPELYQACMWLTFKLFNSKCHRQLDRGEPWDVQTGGLSCVGPYKHDLEKENATKRSG